MSWPQEYGLQFKYINFSNSFMAVIFSETIKVVYLLATLSLRVAIYHD